LLRWFLFAALTLAWVLVSTPEAASEERRIALVIGNGSYQSAPLRNPVNDARDMAELLQRLDFQVLHYSDLGQSGMRDAIRRFGRRIRGGGIGLFYFAGHGMQVDGANYLIPVDTDIQEEDEVADQAVNAALVLAKMRSAGNALNVVILDACRNNPFARSFRSSTRGLARMRGPTGTFIAYATAPGSVSFDGEGDNGVYTKHLLENLQTPGLTIEQVFRRVRNGVRQQTAGKQTPWESSSLVGGDLYIAGRRRRVVGATPVPNFEAPVETAAEVAFWNSIRQSENTSYYQAYLDQYPDGRFAVLARLKLGELTSDQAARDRQRALDERQLEALRIDQRLQQAMVPSQPPPAPDSQARTDHRVRLAVLPFDLVDEARSYEFAVAAGIEQALRLSPGHVPEYVSNPELANRLRAEVPVLGGDVHGQLWDKTSRWQRGAPNSEAIYRLGAELGVDEVLMVSVEGRQEGGVQNAALACYVDTYILKIAEPVPCSGLSCTTTPEIWPTST